MRPIETGLLLLVVAVLAARLGLVRPAEGEDAPATRVPATSPAEGVSIRQAPSEARCKGTGKRDVGRPCRCGGCGKTSEEKAPSGEPLPEKPSAP